MFEKKRKTFVGRHCDIARKTTASCARIPCEHCFEIWLHQSQPGSLLMMTWEKRNGWPSACAPVHMQDISQVQPQLLEMAGIDPFTKFFLSPLLLSNSDFQTNKSLFKKFNIICPRSVTAIKSLDGKMHKWVTSSKEKEVQRSTLPEMAQPTRF